MTEFTNEEQQRFQRKIREAIENLDKDRVSREQISDVLQYEEIQVEFGSKENQSWLEGLGKPVDQREDEKYE